MPKLPSSIGKYKVIDRLGRGGMGLVYKALHPTLDTFVVLKKLMLKGDSVHRERFRREAALMMALRHENVIGVYDHFKAGSACFLAMEYVDGYSLAELIAQEGPMHPDEAAWLIGKVALALEHIHENDIIHRDLKLSNILLARDGSVKLGDFGIAFSPGGSDVLTDEGTALGTPSFMAPEQLVDARQADERSDIWSLGVCFFELLTSMKFVAGPTPAAIRALLPTAVKSYRKKLPGTLSHQHRRFLKKCLQIRSTSRMSGGNAAVKTLSANRNQEMPTQLKYRLDRLFGSEDVLCSHPSEPPVTHENTGTRKLLRLDSLFSRIVRKSEKDQLEIRRNIRDTKENLRWPQFSSLAVIAVPVLFILTVLLVPGLWDEIMRANRYGRLQLSLDFPDQAPTHWISSVKARIYTMDGDNLTEIADPILRLNRDNTRLRSRPISLQSGPYRLSWSLGDRIVWKSFNLSSIKENRAQGNHPFLIEETLGEPPVFPLNLEVVARNALTEEEVPVQVTWERLDESAGEFESGGLYKLTFESDGFIQETFTIATSPWRREVSIHAALWPNPGYIRLHNSSSRRILPRFNGKRSYLNLAGNPGISNLQFLSPGENDLYTLLPGEYTITPGLGKKGRQQLTLDSGRQLNLIIEMGSDKNTSIRIRQENQ